MRNAAITDHALEQWVMRAPPIVGEYEKADVEQAWRRGQMVLDYTFDAEEVRHDRETGMVLFRKGEVVTTVMRASTAVQRANIPQEVADE